MEEIARKIAELITIKNPLYISSKLEIKRDGVLLPFRRKDVIRIANTTEAIWWIYKFIKDNDGDFFSKYGENILMVELYDEGRELELQLASWFDSSEHEKISYFANLRQTGIIYLKR